MTARPVLYVADWTNDDFGTDEGTVDHLVDMGTLTPVKKPDVYYRLVVRAVHNGKLHRFRKRSLRHATEDAAWYLDPENRSHYYKGCEVWIEVQHAAPWATVATLTPADEEDDGE